MADMKLYEYEVNGIKHTAQMTSDHAKAYPGAKEVKAAPVPKNKQAATAENKSA